MANTHSLDLEQTSSQYVYITDANQTGLDLSGSFTLEAWIKMEELPSSLSGSNPEFIIISKDESNNSTSSGSYSWSIQSSWGDKMWLHIINDAGNVIGDYLCDTAFTSSDVGVWRHIAVVYNNSAPSATFYIDGVVQTTSNYTNNTGTINNTAIDFRIGWEDGNSNSPVYFDGLIDDVRVWNITRTSTEINNDKDTQLNGNETGLVGYWRFNNDYTDETSNNNDLTAVNSPVFSTDVPFTDTVSYTLTASQGFFTLTGISALLERGYNLICSLGTYTLTGIDTALRYGYKIVCSAGSYILSGLSAGLYGKFKNLTKTSNTFTNQNKNSNTFTNLNK